MAESRVSAGSGGRLEIYARMKVFVVYQGQYQMRRKSLGWRITIASFGNAVQNAKDGNITSTPYEFEIKGVDSS